jgi:hypothetical protein
MSILQIVSIPLRLLLSLGHQFFAQAHAGADEAANPLSSPASAITGRLPSATWSFALFRLHGKFLNL